MQRIISSWRRLTSSSAPQQRSEEKSRPLLFLIYELFSLPLIPPHSFAPASGIVGEKIYLPTTSTTSSLGHLQIFRSTSATSEPPPDVVLPSSTARPRAQSIFSRSSPSPPRMLRRYALGFSNVGRQISTMGSNTPMEDTIRAKLTAAFNPLTLEIYNDSHQHAHHKAMSGTTSKETHFRLVIISEAFVSKMQPARHRMVYALLTEELAQTGGIHALQLKTLTPEEAKRQKQKRDAEIAAKAEAKEERQKQRDATAADKKDPEVEIPIA